MFRIVLASIALMIFTAFFLYTLREAIRDYAVIGWFAFYLPGLSLGFILRWAAGLWLAMGELKHR